MTIGWFIAGSTATGSRAPESTSRPTMAIQFLWLRRIPETVYSMFQLTFAIIIPAALIFGSTAERMKFSAMLWFTVLWACSSTLRSRMGWGPDGMFNGSNLDSPAGGYGGASVAGPSLRRACWTSRAVPWCTSIRGTAGMMCALMLGKRKDTGPAHNMLLPYRCSMRGSAGSLQRRFLRVTAACRRHAMLVTHTATATAVFTGMIVGWILKGNPPSSASARARCRLVPSQPASGSSVDGLVLDRRRGRHHLHWGCPASAHVRLRTKALDTFGCTVSAARRRDPDRRFLRSPEYGGNAGCRGQLDAARLSS